METIKNMKDKHPILMGGLIFIVLSFVANALWILCLDMAHIYDIIHAMPVAIIYDPIIKAMGGLVTTEWIYVPLAVVMDGVMGLLITACMQRFIKDREVLVWSIVGAFCVYWILVCYQWLPLL
ncbi:MAG: hypothetical protein ACRCWY_02255 [Cellulosilyticaceae bacterium]